MAAALAHLVSFATTGSHDSSRHQYMPISSHVLAKYIQDMSGALSACSKLTFAIGNWKYAEALKQK